MRKMILALAILYPAVVFAQGTTAPAPANPAPPPTVGGKPLVVVGSKKAATGTKSAKPAAPPKPQSVAQKLQVCQDIDDGTKDRLNCYDAVIPPKPNPKAKPPAKAVTECNAFKDEEERLTCFNGFVEKLPKLPS